MGIVEPPYINVVDWVCFNNSFSIAEINGIYKYIS